jgi:hypothetical protein
MHIEVGFARGLHIFGRDELPLIRFLFSDAFADAFAACGGYSPAPL